MIWCIQRTNIYLDPQQCELLDRQAAEEGVSRAELIRRLIDRALAGRDADLASDLDAIEASFGVLSGADAVVARDPGDREAHLAAMWRLRP
jgi:hypothetical protein